MERREDGTKGQEMRKEAEERMAREGEKVAKNNRIRGGFGRIKGVKWSLSWSRKRFNKAKSRKH